MPYLFDNLEAVLEVLTLSPLGLITDIDGTISEIAAYPEEARVSPRCRESLATLSKRLALVAAISGRPAQQAREMIGVEGMVYIGNHGLERWADGKVAMMEGVAEYGAKVKATLGELGSLLAMEGIALENKGIALSIHYRQCPHHQMARGYIMERIAKSPSARGFRIVEGRMVVELRPPVEVNKGIALLGLVESYRLKGGIYLGDDISDVDAFAALHSAPFKGLALGVVDEETSHQVEKEADFTLNGVGDAERFLRWLAATVPEPER